MVRWQAECCANFRLKRDGCRLNARFPESPIEEEARSERGWRFHHATSGWRNICFVAVQEHLIPTHERGGGEICKNHGSGKQGPHDINGETWVSSNKLGDTYPWIGDQRGQNLRLLLLWKMERMGPEVLEKLQILNVQRMIFGRGRHAVGEAKRSG